MKSAPILYVVVPCYNEEACLDETTKRLQDKLKHLEKAKKISSNSRIVYVDDGSKDHTWAKISSYRAKVIGIKLAHNRGHQNALLAGLMYAKDHCDISISMDADLQDDIESIDKMICEYFKGYNIVYGVRSSRATDTKFKRNSALAFYKLMHWLGVEITYNSADYRLLSRRVLESLSGYKEVNLFLRGIIPSIGFPSTTVTYKRAERFAGESKYPFKKMLSFAWDGITSFSVKPIRFILSIGVIVAMTSVIVLVYCLIAKLLGQTVDGWTFTVCSIWLLGGIQIASLGIVGEYVGKIYMETKARPRYIIEEIHQGNRINQKPKNEES